MSKINCYEIPLLEKVEELMNDAVLSANSYTDNEISNIPPPVDLSEYATETYVNTKSNSTLLSAKNYTDQKFNNVPVEISCFTLDDSAIITYDYQTYLLLPDGVSNFKVSLITFSASHAELGVPNKFIIGAYSPTAKTYTIETNGYVFDTGETYVRVERYPSDTGDMMNTYFYRANAYQPE